MELWVKEGKVRRIEFDYSPYFYLHLPDEHRYAEMLEALESLYRVEECSFSTIYGELNGYRICCNAKEIRKLAEKIELQTRFQARLYNVDIRLDQRFFAERNLVPCCEGNDRFSLEFCLPNLRIAEVEVKGERCYPSVNNRIAEIRVNRTVLRGSESQILEEFSQQIKLADPDVILFPHADYWMDLITKKAGKYGIKLSMSRNGRFRKLESKTYFSYGRTLYRPSAYIPAGRILIDTESFNYREGGLKGILLASRLACIPANYASRFTPGTLISSYEVYEALKRGIAVPFRKRDAENARSLEELKIADRGGMVFQPKPGVYENVFQLDFTSMYPAIIVKYNLSPESDGRFLPEVLEPLLKLRIETKRRKKENSAYEGMDSILKWMLVTCFGYTGYKNAKFGRIEVHESITRIGREILLKAKQIAESMDFEVLHGIVDCLWIKGNGINKLKEKVEKETGLLTDIEHYNWIVFLPMKDNTGAYSRYYGRLAGGKLKLRGVFAKRSDTPEYIRKMQLELFDKLSGAETLDGIHRLKDKLLQIYREYRSELKRGDVNAEKLAIHRRISKLSYSRRCPEINAIRAYRKSGIRLAAGMSVSFVVVSARNWIVDLPWKAKSYDERYYLKLLDKAWEEVSFILNFQN